MDVVPGPGSNRANATNRAHGYPTGDGFLPVARKLLEIDPPGATHRLRNENVKRRYE